MATVTIHLNNDGLGGSRWWAESDGFSAAADDIDELLRLVREWADDEGTDYRLILVEDRLTEEEAATTAA